MWLRGDFLVVGDGKRCPVRRDDQVGESGRRDPDALGIGVAKSGARWALCRVPTGNRLGGSLGAWGHHLSTTFSLAFVGEAQEPRFLGIPFLPGCQDFWTWASLLGCSSPTGLPSSHPTPSELKLVSVSRSSSSSQTVTGARMGGEWTCPAIETFWMHWRFDIRLAVPKPAWRCGWNGTGAFKGQTRQFLALWRMEEGKRRGSPLPQDRDQGPPSSIESGRCRTAEIARSHHDTNPHFPPLLLHRS